MSRKGKGITAPRQQWILPLALALFVGAGLMLAMALTTGAATAISDGIQNFEKELQRQHQSSSCSSYTAERFSSPAPATGETLNRGVTQCRRSQVKRLVRPH